VVDDSNKIANL